MNNTMENIGLLNKLGIGKYLKKVKEYVDVNKPYIETTYDNLVNLRNNSQLIPGWQYRITDYVTTTSQPLTMSAGHQFDIIVTADSENTLNEKARACIHRHEECDISKYDVCYSAGVLEQPLNFIQDYTYNDKTYRLYRNSEYEILIDFCNLITPEDYTPNTFNFAVVSNYIKYPDENDWIPWTDDGCTLEFEFDPYLVYPYQKAYNLSDGCNVNYIEDYEYLEKTYKLYEDDNGVQYLMDFTKQRNVVEIDVDFMDFKYGVFPDFRRQTSEDDWELGAETQIIGFKYNPNDPEKYFSKNKLEAWEIWYSLDNDMTRFEWATDYLSPETNKKMLMVNDDFTTCKGTNFVFVRNEEYDEDGKCAWLFDNGWEADALGDEATFRFYVRNGVESIDDSNIIFTENENPNIGDILISNNEFFFKLTNISIGKGVIYRMIDEFGNDCPYDFKNILYIRNISSSNGIAEFDESEDPKWVYTFSGQSYNLLHSYYSNTNWYEYMLDGSLLSPYSFYSDELISQTFTNNIIKPYLKAYDDFSTDEIDMRKNIGRMALNDIVMLGYWEEIGSADDEHYIYYSYCCHFNSFGYDCHNNSFEHNCHNNSFGNNCHNNSFRSFCSINSFEDNCFNNSFGYECYKNSFGFGCTFNSFGNNCDDNSFGRDCYNNSFEDSYSNNSFGNSCDSNSFGYQCSGNSFGDWYYNNSFGDWCTYNSFGNYCSFNSFGNYCSFNSFGNDCRHNSFRISASTSSSLKSYCQYNHFDDGCSYNVIWNSDTTGSATHVKNINVNRGVVGINNSYNIIHIDVLNQDYEIQVAKNSKGEIKIYCEADLIA